MNLQRFAEIVDAYGAGPSRWPLAEREAARTLLRDSAEARELLARAASIDAALDSAEKIAVPAGLAERILASRNRESLWDRLRALWPGPSAWRPAFAVTVSAFLGLGVGLTVPVFPPGDDAEDTIEIAAIWLGDNDVLDLSTEIENDD